MTKKQAFRKLWETRTDSDDPDKLERAWQKALSGTFWYVQKYMSVEEILEYIKYSNRQKGRFIE